MGGPFEWAPKTLIGRVQDWLLSLEDYPRVLSTIRELDDNGNVWTEYSEIMRQDKSSWLQQASPLLDQIRQLLFCETGMAVLRCGTTLTGNQARLVELLVGCSLGENVTMTPGQTERALFQARTSEDPTAGAQYVGSGLKPTSIGLHTDGSGTIDRKVEVLEMLFIRPARFGGQSLVANSQLAFKNLNASTKRILQRSFPRQNPYKDGPLTTLLCIPIFKDVPNRWIEFSYHPARIRNGVKLARSSKSDLKNASTILIRSETG